MVQSRRRILVSGMMAGDPHQGGATWAVLHYVLGLKRLGHDVFFVEPIRQASLRPEGAGLVNSINAAYFTQVIRDFGLERKAALFEPRTQVTVGCSLEELRHAAREADVLLNISGLLDDTELISRIPVRAYLDLDPAFNQLWHAQGIDRGFAGHTHWVTVGQALGRPGCTVPPCGIPWLKTMPPVVLEQWPVAGLACNEAFTTVANWRGYGSIEHAGVFFGQKAHSLRSFITLPQRTHVNFLLALAIHPDEERDLEALATHGWHLVDPTEAACTPSRYQGFIQGSMAEFGIAKSGYVTSRCGWFSDRSACYLASGRPVIAQDTGFSSFLPTGKGLLTFETMNDVVAAIDSVCRDYDGHSRAARALAEEFFDSDIVLTRLLAMIGVA